MYTKTTWVNRTAPYLEALNLNHMEKGIFDNSNAIDAIGLGETAKGEWTPTAGTEYPSSPTPGDSYFIAGLSTPYTFAGGDLTGKETDNQDKIYFSDTGWLLVEQRNIPTDIVKYVDTIADLSSVGINTYTVAIVKEDKRGGTFVYDAARSGENDGGVVFDGWVRQYDKQIEAVWFGALQDQTTDSTQSVKDGIASAHNEGENLYINSDIKWSTQDILEGVTGTISTSSPTVISGLSGLVPDEHIGDFVWNTTDYSYGEVISNTATSITVAALYLGATNTFNVGDIFTVSGFKTGVTIIDDSRWSEPNGSFTGQYKVFLNSTMPHAKSANEFWAYGQYHPAIVACNIGTSDMEHRASFLARTYKPNGKIRNFMQFGINPLNNIDSVLDPTSAGAILLVIGHDEGVENDNTGSTIASSWRSSDNNKGVYFALGTRAVEGIHQLYDSSSLHEITNIKYNTSDNHMDITREVLGVDKETTRMWSTGGTSGTRTAVFPHSLNFNITERIYTGCVHTNEGATGDITIYFPEISDIFIGATITLINDNGNDLRAVPKGTDAIRGMTEATPIIMTNEGETLTVIATKSGIWDVLSHTGIN